MLGFSIVFIYIHIFVFFCNNVLCDGVIVFFAIVCANIDSASRTKCLSICAHSPQTPVRATSKKRVTHASNIERQGHFSRTFSLSQRRQRWRRRRRQWRHHHDETVMPFRRTPCHMCRRTSSSSASTIHIPTNTQCRQYSRRFHAGTRTRAQQFAEQCCAPDRRRHGIESHWRVLTYSTVHNIFQLNYHIYYTIIWCVYVQIYICTIRSILTHLPQIPHNKRDANMKANRAHNMLANLWTLLQYFHFTVRTRVCLCLSVCCVLCTECTSMGVMEERSCQQYVWAQQWLRPNRMTKNIIIQHTETASDRQSAMTTRHAWRNWNGAFLSYQVANV